MDIRRTLHKYKQQKDHGGDYLRGFLLRRWWKATKPTGIAGPLFLAKKYFAWGKLATGSIFLRLGREAWHSKVWSIAVSCYAKIKTAKMSSKANTAFWRNFAPAISRYCVEVCRVCTQPLARVWYWDNTSTLPPQEQPKSSFELYSKQRKQRRMLQRDK